MKTVVVLRGGGLFGAFGCGAWSALAPLLAQCGDTVIGVGGCGLGAVNAAVIARSLEAASAPAPTADRDPGIPFVLPVLWAWTGRPPSADTAAWPGGAARRFALPWRRPAPDAAARRLPLAHQPSFAPVLRSLVGAYRSGREARRPLLCVGVAREADGMPLVFDSDAGALTLRHLAAATAAPGALPPVVLAGGVFRAGSPHDGYLPLLAALVGRARAAERLGDGEPLRIVRIEQVEAGAAEPDEAGLPVLRRHAGPVCRLTVRRLRPSGEPADGPFDATHEALAARVAEGVHAAREAWLAAQPGPHAAPADLALAG